MTAHAKPFGVLTADAHHLSAMLMVLEHVADPNSDLGHDLEKADMEILARCQLAELVLKMSRDLAADLDRFDEQMVGAA
jgi:hypothetical protein